MLIEGGYIAESSKGSVRHSRDGTPAGPCAHRSASPVFYPRFFPAWHQSLQCHPLAVPRRGDKRRRRLQKSRSPPQSHPASPNSPKIPSRQGVRSHARHRRTGGTRRGRGQAGSWRGSAWPRGADVGLQGNKRSLAFFPLPSFATVTENTAFA